MQVFRHGRNDAYSRAKEAASSWRNQDEVPLIQNDDAGDGEGQPDDGER